MKRRALTEIEKADADRLMRVWEKFKAATGTTQEQAAQEMGFESQGAISHYLNGRTPLNIDAAAKFARLTKTPVDEFSPYLAEKIRMAYSVTRHDEYIPTTTQAKLTAQLVDGMESDADRQMAVKIVNAIKESDGGEGTPQVRSPQKRKKQRG